MVVKLHNLFTSFYFYNEFKNNDKIRSINYFFLPILVSLNNEKSWFSICKN